MDFDKVLAMLDAMGRERVDYVLVGGLALGLHGLVRATEDVDIFVQPNAANVERLRRALRTIWDDPEIEQITSEDLAGEYPAVRYGPPGETYAIDILASLGSRFRYEDLQWETIEIDGVEVRTATPQSLYRMKRDTVRPIDKADAAALREKFALEDN